MPPVPPLHAAARPWAAPAGPARLLVGPALLLASGCPLVSVVEPLPDPCADVVCGVGEICYDGLCSCMQGYVDNDQGDGCLAVQVLLMTDGCDDGRDTDWRVWASDGGWVWPGGVGSFVTWGLGVVSEESIACRDGEELCFGAEAGARAWGVGLGGDLGCEGCCWLCAPDTVDLGALVCE